MTSMPPIKLAVPNIKMTVAPLKIYINTPAGPVSPLPFTDTAR